MAEDDTTPPSTPAPDRSRNKGPLTALDREERIDYAANVLLTYHRRSEQIAAITQKYGIKWRQACTYLKYARDRIQEASRMPKLERLAQLIDFWESKMLNPLVLVKDQLRASQLLARASEIGVGGVVVHAQQVNVGPDPLAALDLAAIAAASREARLQRVADREVGGPEPITLPEPTKPPRPPKPPTAPDGGNEDEDEENDVIWSRVPEEVVA